MFSASWARTHSYSYGFFGSEISCLVWITKKSVSCCSSVSSTHLCLVRCLVYLYSQVHIGTNYIYTSIYSNVEVLAPLVVELWHLIEYKCTFILCRSSYFRSAAIDFLSATKFQCMLDIMHISWTLRPTIAIVKFFIWRSVAWFGSRGNQFPVAPACLRRTCAWFIVFLYIISSSLQHHHLYTTPVSSLCLAPLRLILQLIWYLDGFWKKDEREYLGQVFSNFDYT